MAGLSAVGRFAFGVWRSAFSVWRLAFGVRRLAFGAWRWCGEQKADLSPIKNLRQLTAALLY